MRCWVLGLASRPEDDGGIMSKRIDDCFARLREQDRAAIVAYVMAGDPDAETTLKVMQGLPGAGADIIELGFPFSDPMAEGPPIQRAAQREPFPPRRSGDADRADGLSQYRPQSRLRGLRQRCR